MPTVPVRPPVVEQPKTEDFCPLGAMHGWHPVAQGAVFGLALFLYTGLVVAISRRKR